MSQIHFVSTLLQACSGVVLDNALVGDLLFKYSAVFTASAQYFVFSPDSINIDFAFSTIVLFALSATPFCCGVYSTLS
jgi:hypothetical protein